ncbi:WD40/YVTN/BNR-like repeat-containing protein [Halolamina rubra]|uniref:WD40/YVTN/BNR-like repeat-containing protein n=1 Tax=Halolamina rubra TaxID=1380430 RepID=UPI000679537E|nr:sialidase family protein [Halolamina rubra]
MTDEHYNQPAQGTENWDDPLNENFSDLGVEVANEVATWSDLPATTEVSQSSDGQWPVYRVEADDVFVRVTDSAQEIVGGLGSTDHKLPEQHVEKLSADETQSATPVEPDYEQGSRHTQLGAHANPVSPNIHYHGAQSRGNFRVRFQNGDTLVANQANSPFTVYRSTDRGDTWTQKGDLNSRPNDALVELSTGTLIAVLDDQTVQRSTDGGSTWTQVDTLNQSDGQVRPNGITETPNGTVLYGEYGNTSGDTYRIRRSADDGQTWTTVRSESISGGSAQFHSVMVDPHDTGKIVAFVDEVYRTLLSTDDGQTWTELWADDRAKPLNYMFFENSIGWAQDRGTNNGWVRRLSRSDFYNGNLGQLEHIARPTKDVAPYEAWRVDHDMWLLSYAAGDRNNDDSSEPVAPMFWAVWEDGRRAAPLGLFSPADQKLGVPSGKVEVPTQKFDSHANSRTYLSVDDSQWSRSSVPITVTLGGGVGNQMTNSLMDAIIPYEGRVQGADSGGSVHNILRWAQNLVLRNPQAPNTPEILLRDDDEIWFRRDGSITMVYDDVWLNLYGNGVKDIRKGGSSAPGLRFLDGAGFFVDNNGEIVARDEAGNETIIT